MFHQEASSFIKKGGDNDRNTSVLDFEMTKRITMKLGEMGTVLGGGRGKICSGPF
jgi:hypothetical protein